MQSTRESHVPEKKRVHKRRTQKERTDETRDKILRGAARCIVEVGFKATTMKAIAEAAGVTWGAIQHHFGDKASIMIGVTELGAAEFAASFSDIDPTGMSIEQRVNVFLERARKQTEDELYHASLVIFRNRRQKLRPREYQLIEKALRDIWDFVFKEVRGNNQRFSHIRDFAFMTINAIALERATFEESERHTSHHFRMLNDFLVSSLGEGR